jgi:hypothetical protein
MEFFNYMMLVVGLGMFTIALAIVANDSWLVVRYRRRVAVGAVAIEPQPIRWRTTVALTCLAWGPILTGIGVVAFGINR